MVPYLVRFIDNLTNIYVSGALVEAGGPWRLCGGACVLASWQPEMRGWKL